MAYDSLTSRVDAGALIPEEVSKEMLRVATTQSAVLQRFRRIPVSRAQVRFPILSALPVAYWVDGDTGLKQTADMAWTNKYLNIEEIATIQPVPDNVLADVDANIWDEAMPFLVEAVARVLDSAVFFGTNAPSSFPTNITTAVTGASNDVDWGTAPTGGGAMADFDLAYAKLDADGFDPDGIVASTILKSKLRSARDSTGQKLDPGRVSPRLDEFDGLPVSYPMRGLWGTSSGSPQAFVGDFSQFIVGVRQDINVKVSTDAVIQNASGAIVYNSFQQDLTFLRLTFRVGWQVANLINRDEPTEANRYPVASITVA